MLNLIFNTVFHEVWVASGERCLKSCYIQALSALNGRFCLEDFSSCVDYIYSMDGILSYKM